MANYPDGGQVSVCYSDTSCGTSSYPLTATVTKKTGEVSGDEVSRTTYDGLARPILSQTQTSANFATSINEATTYDNLGRVYMVSNPYYATTDATYGSTTFNYDASGRKVNQTDSDGSSRQTWIYSGNSVLYQDENGNQWNRTEDALGRLTKVVEPSGATSSPSLETDYGYDPLDNLVSVRQWGGVSGSTGAENRTFTYDSLSRLLCASNPENSFASCPTTATNSYTTGTTGYRYDANGNVLSKTDARSIVTSYLYDSLNRVLSKSYSNDTASTPFSCYRYDSSSVPNSIGRLTDQWTQSPKVGLCASTPPTSKFLSKRSVLSFDPLGRVLNEQQCTPSNCSSGSAYLPQYTYDLAGGLRTFTNGISTTPGATASPLQFTNTYDATGRLSSLTSNWNDSTHPPSIFSLRTGQSNTCSSTTTPPYTAFGGLTNATIGANLTLNRSFDNRLRTVCEQDTTGNVSPATPGSATITVTGVEQSQ